MTFPAARDRDLVDFLRASPDVPAWFARVVTAASPGFVANADRHGVGGLVCAAIANHPDTRSDVRARASARLLAGELDHEAQLAALGRVDRALAEAKVNGVVLKGALLARRYFALPATRTSTDIDLLVAPGSLAHAEVALAAAGYAPIVGPREDWFRANHHHVHLQSADGLPLELHFHAYRGFGRILPAAPLLARRLPVAGFEAIGVLSEADELVYLAVHAAAHRFERLGWLYDCKLVVERMSASTLALARERAEAWGYARPLALAASLLRDFFGVDAARLAPLVRLGGLGRVAEAVARRVVATPSSALLRSATRFVYTTSLAPSVGAAASYAVRSSADHARRILGRDR